MLAFIHPNIKSDIGTKLLNNLWYHTENFYHNELSGSLASKISTIQGSVRNLLDNSRRIFRFSCEIIFACVSTRIIHPVFILVILGWSSVFVVFGFMFSSKLNKLAYKVSESNNKMVGKIVDVLANIFTVKTFYRHNFENKYISFYFKGNMNRDILQASHG